MRILHTQRKQDIKAIDDLCKAAGITIDPAKVTIAPIKSWSDQQGRYVHGPAFWDAVQSGEAIILANYGPLKFIEWAIKRIIQDGNRLVLIDADGWRHDFVSSNSPRSWDLVNKMFYQKLVEELAYEKACFRIQMESEDILITAEQMLGSELDEDAYVQFRQDMPSWMHSKSNSVVMTAELIPAHDYLDKYQRLGHATASIKERTRYTTVLLTQQDQWCEDNDASTLPDKAEYDAFRSMCGTPDDFDHFEGTYRQWERLGSLENYFRDDSEDLPLYESSIDEE